MEVLTGSQACQDRQSKDLGNDGEHSRMMDICIKKVKSPAHFWGQIIRKDRNDDEFALLYKEIQQYFNDSTFSKSRVCNPIEGKRCVVRMNNRSWCRAVIDQVLVSTNGLIINCNLLDEVDLVYFRSCSVYEAPNWVWRLPVRSALMGLYGIAPLKLQADYVGEKMSFEESKNMKRWDPATIQYFKDLCSRYTSMKAQIIETDDNNVSWIRLFVPSNDKEGLSCVNEDLLSQKMAAVRSVKYKSDGRSTSQSSDDSASDRKYLSPMQLCALREKLTRLLNENTRDAFCDSSEDESDSSSSCSRNMRKHFLDQQNNNVRFARKGRIREQTHFAKEENLKRRQVTGKKDTEHSDRSAEVSKIAQIHSERSKPFRDNLEINASLPGLGNSGQFLKGMSSISHKNLSLASSLSSSGVDGCLRNSHSVLAKSKPKRFQAKAGNECRIQSCYSEDSIISRNAKGVPVRTVALQTQPLDIVSGPADDEVDESLAGHRDAGSQVNFDETTAKAKDIPETPNMPSVVKQSKTNLEDIQEFGNSSNKGALSLKKTEDLFGLQFSADSEPRNQVKESQKIENERQEHKLHENDFYIKAPRKMLVLDMEGDEKLSELTETAAVPGELCDTSDEDGTAVKPKLGKNTLRNKTAPIQTVFVPDNLHSGSVILIRGDNPPNPISLFCKAPFSEYIRDLLEFKLRFKGPRLIQAYTWPAILSRRDVLALAPRGGGKTVSYLVPVASLILKQHYRCESKQPIAIVVTTNWTDAQDLHQLFRAFLAERGDEHNVIAVYGGNPSEDSKATEIAAGCSVLICTAPSLVRICSAKYINFSRLKYLILDDINILAEEFTEELKKIMMFRANSLSEAAAALKSCQPSQMICIGSQWTVGVKSFTNRFLTNQPLVLISHPLEAAVYGNVKHRIIVCNEGQRLEDAVSVLHDWEENKQGAIAIFVQRPSEVNALHEIIKSLGFYCLKAHSEMCQGEIDELRQQFEDESSHLVVLATDDIILDLDIYTVQTVIHFSFPDQHELGVRLSTMQSFFSPEPEKATAVSFFLVSQHDALHAFDLVKFLERIRQPVPQDLKILVESFSKNLEQHKASIPLCPLLKSFGRCREEKVCRYRHHIFVCDQPNNDSCYAKIPESGHVRMQITHVVDATHYYGRLIALRVGEGSDSRVVKYDATYAEVTKELAAYFRKPENHMYLKEDAKSGEVYALTGTFVRACVLRLAKPYLLNRKDLQEWSGARRQVFDNEPPVCWTTPGGARKTCVQLVDTGSVRVVRCDELMIIPSKLASVPFQAVEVRACGVCPVDKDTRWLHRANEFIHENLFKKEIEGNIMMSLGHTMWLNPVVVRSKLPLANCLVTDFHVAQALIEKKFGDANPSHLEFLKTARVTETKKETKRNRTAALERSISSHRNKPEAFATCKAIKVAEAVRSGYLSEASTARSTPTDHPASEASNSSDETISNKVASFNSIVPVPKLPCRAPSTSPDTELKTQQTVPAFNVSQVTSGTSNKSASGPGAAYNIPGSIEAHPNITDHQDPVTCDASSDLETQTEDAGVRTKIETETKESLDTVHLLCERFMSRKPDDPARMETANEVYMRCVGCSFDISESDMVSLSRVLDHCKTIEEKLVFVGALLSLAGDQVPVANYVKVGKLVKTGCCYDMKGKEEENGEKEHFLQALFSLCQELIDSWKNNSKVDDHCTLAEVNEAIFDLQQYLNHHAHVSADALDNAENTLFMLSCHRQRLQLQKRESEDEKKKEAKPIAVPLKKVVTDVLNYDRFNFIDTDTDADSVRPYSPVVCRFDTATEVSTASTETEDDFCGL